MLTKSKLSTSATDRQDLHLSGHQGMKISKEEISTLLQRLRETQRTFLAFLALFELGSLLSAAATSSKMFIVGRAVAGMGGSGIINGALTIVANCAPMHKRPSTPFLNKIEDISLTAAVLIGLMMSICQLGLVLGPVIGGALTQYATWRWCKFSPPKPWRLARRQLETHS